MAGRDRASERPMDRTAIDRSLRLEGDAAISHSRSGLLPMARSSFGAFGRWAFATDRSRRDRHGRTDMRRGLSVQSGGIALTTWSSLANGTFVICFTHTKATTTRLRTHLSLDKDAPVPRRGAGTRPRGFSADLGRPTPSIRSDLSFRQGQGRPHVLRLES